MEAFDGLFLFFFLLLLTLICYWYISIPLIALMIWVYIKTSHNDLRLVLRVVFAFVILSVIGGLSYLFLH